MFDLDLFGRAAKARVKALEEALEREIARNKDLTKQVFALSDVKALRAVEAQPRIQKANLEAKGEIKRPLQVIRTDDIVRAARTAIMEKPRSES